MILGLALVVGLLLLAQSIERSMWLVYPRDSWDCPSGSERWGRVVGGKVVYACFELHDQKGG